MMKTEVKYNIQGLNNLAKSIGGNYTARVGIIGSKASQEHTLKKNGFKGVARSQTEGLSNSQIGAIQMFGSVTANIPPRDFLRMPIQFNQRQILRAMQTSMVKTAVEKGEYKKVFKLLGAVAEGFVQKAFETGGFGQWLPLKAGTKARKGSSAILIDTGQLRRAISSDVVEKGTVQKSIGKV